MDRRYIWGAVVAAVVVVGVLIGFSVTGGSTDSETVDSLDDVAQIQAMLEGIPAAGATIGDPNAPIEIIEFGDLQCPACRDASVETIPELVERYVEPGQVRLTYQPIAFIGADSERGAFGALAAAQQDALWPFVEVLFHNQGAENSGWLSDDTMAATAEAIGIDAERWRADYDNSDLVVPAYREAQSVADENGVNSTPTFIVRGPGGEETIEGAGGIELFDQAIEAVGAA